MKSCLSRALMGSLLLVSLIPMSAEAQSSIGIGTDVPDASSSLDILSTNTGVLIPRLTTAQRNGNITGIGGGQEGLLIYNLTDSEFNYWDGTQWLAFPGGDDDWYENGTPPRPPDNISDAIFTNGNVGIGVNIPTQSFHIANTSAALQTIRVDDLSQTGNGYNPTTATVSLANRATVFVDRTTGIMYSEDANRAYWRLDGNSGVVNAGYSSSCPNLISGSMNASGYEYIGTNDNTDFIVATNDRERLRVLRDGQLVVYGKGITTPASSPTGCVPAYPVIDAASFYGTGNTYPLNAYSENVPAVYGAALGTGQAAGVAGTIYGAGDGVIGYVSGTPNGGSVGVRGEEVTLAGWAVLAVGDIGVTGGIFAASDRRFKENIIPYGDGLDIVMQLRPKKYDFRSEFKDYGINGTDHIGFIAQEVEEVVPDIVKLSTIPGMHIDKGSEAGTKRDLENMYTLNMQGLVPILTSAIQQQQSQIESLQQENADMKRRLLALEQHLFTPPPGTPE